MASSFDVFVSYHSADRTMVEVLLEHLKGRLIRVWIDDGQLPPGSVGFQRQIEAAVHDAPAVLVAVGPSGIGTWQQVEIDLCLEESTRRALPVIPVLLPGGLLSQIPSLLTSRFSIADFSEGFENTKGFDRLEWGITGHVVAALVAEPSAEASRNTAPDFKDRLDAFAMANVKARVYKVAEATAALAASVLAGADETGQHDLTRWVSLLISLRWERGYLMAFERLFCVRRTERSLQDFDLTLLCDDDQELDGVLSAALDGSGAIAVSIDGRTVATVRVPVEADRVLVERGVNGYGRLGRPLSGSRSLKSRLGSVPIATIEHQDSELVTAFYQNREILAVLAARFGMPGQDQLLLPRPQRIDRPHPVAMDTTAQNSEPPGDGVLLQARRAVAVGDPAAEAAYQEYLKTLERTPEALAAVRELFGEGPDAIRASWDMHLAMRAKQNRG
jgi:hypothetical protein